MDSRIKTEFIKQELKKIGKDIDRAQLMAIRKLLHFRTGRLERDRIFEVSKTEGLDGELILTHPDYERFLDVKKKPRVSENVEHFRKRTYGKQKSYPIHNRIIMGHYNRLASNLMFGLTSEVANEIKRQLDNQTI